MDISDRLGRVGAVRDHLQFDAGAQLQGCADRYRWRCLTRNRKSAVPGYLDNRFVPTPRLLPAWQAGADTPSSYTVAAYFTCRPLCPGITRRNCLRAYFFSPRPSFLEPGR